MRAKPGLRRRIGVALLWFGLGASALAQAAEQRFAILLDTDNATATGCTIATPAGAAPGIDQVLTTVVTTTTAGASVSRIERQTCAGGTLGTAVVLNPGSWPAGLGVGSNGAAAIESAIALSLLPPSGTMRAIALGTNATGGQDVTPAFLIPLGAPPPAGAPVVPAPISAAALALLALALFLIAARWYRRHPQRLNSLLCLGLVVVSTLAGAVALDGLIADWNGVSPAVTSPQTGPVDADILAVYWQTDSANLYFRIDADVRADAASAVIAVSAGANQSITLPASATLTGSATRTPVGSLTLQWTKVGGPGSVSFSAPDQATTLATFSQSGSYVLRLSASDGTNANSATTTITVSDAPQSPTITVDAGLEQTITLPGAATLAGSATVTPSGTITYSWSYLSGTPAAVIFADATQANTAVTFDQPGDYVLRLIATANGLSNHADVTIHVDDSGPTLAAIPDRQLALGATMNLVLAGSSPSVTETLSYALDAKPAGSALAPPPKIAWTPASGQLGANTFTARVTDSHGRSDAKSFTVTVVHNDRAPVLDSQPDESLPRGAKFARALHATDADGDALTYALDSGPAGMTLAGPQLSWPTAAAAPGRYAVVVRATDPAGLYDVKRFFVTITEAAPPIANDDHYEVHVGETLNVAAPGVLGNDSNPMNGTLAAAKLSDPDKGALNSFNADGSFSFSAPSSVGTPFAPVLKWKKGNAFWSGGSSNLVVVPIPGRSAPVVITSFNPTANASGISALDGATGAVLWTLENYLPAPHDTCFVSVSGGLSDLATGDLDDSGHPAVVLPIVCNGELNYRGGGTRLAAIDAATGTVKWLTAPLGFQITNSPFYFSMTDSITPVIARLKPGQTPSVLFQKVGAGYIDNPATQRACDQFLANSQLSACTGVIALDGSDGSVRRKWIAPADGSIISTSSSNTGATPIVADIPGTCTPCVLANGAVWDADGNLLSNLVGAGGFISMALAKIDDGATAIIRHETGNGGNLVARRADGTLIWQAPIGLSSFNGKMSVGDLDGDGEPDIVVSVAGTLLAYDAHGTLRWVHRFVDSANNATIEDGNRPAIFDLDGDGIAEVIVETTVGVDFLSGKDGSVESELTFAATFGSDGGYHDYAAENSPVVADIDGSGHASVLFAVPTAVYGGSTWIVAFSGANWRDARGVFGEYSYHVSDINDDGTIPQNQGDNFAVPRTNVFGNQAQISAPVDPRTHAQTSFTYTASADGLTSTPATVTIDILPLNRPPVFDSVPPTRYLNGQDLANLYHPHAFDPDVGDTVTYRMVIASGNNVGGTQIDPASGAFRPGYGTLFAGDQSFTISATDSQGATTYQSFTLKQSAGSAALPDVTGQTQANATTALTTAGFAVGNIIEQFASAPEGQVIAQSPVGGATLILGEQVSLTVSQGPQPVAVPFVVGEDRTVANPQLTAFGFTVAPTNVYSNSVPAGQVISQDPAAGTLVSPTPAHPIALTISAGSGLKIRLSQDFVNADGTVTASVAHVALDGTETPIAHPTLAIAQRGAIAAGALPTLSGTTISPASDTLGAFTVIATDTGNGAMDSAVLSVVAPANVAADLEAYALESQTIASVQSLLREAQAAAQASDTTTMTAKATAAVNRWRGFNQRQLRLSAPLSPQGGLPPTTADLIAAGVTQTADDKINLALLESAVAQFDNLVQAARNDGVTDTSLGAAVAPIAQTAQALNAADPSIYGMADAQAEYAMILAHELPDAMDALMNVVGDAAGLPPAAPGIARVNASAQHRATIQTTLLETALVQAISAALDAMNPMTQMASTAKSQLSAAMAIIKLANYYHSSLGTDQLPGVIAGSSQSFLEFFAPSSVVEALGANTKYPVLNEVSFIGPDSVSTQTAAVDALKAAPFANLTTSAVAAANIAFSWDGTAFSASALIAGGIQRPIQAQPGCIFSSDLSCVQLVYPSGIDTVYANPPGSIRIPLPVIVLVRNPLTGRYSMATVVFLPCQAAGQCS